MPTNVTDRMPSSTRGHGARCSCAECAGLECLCRPRFFAGQLLTEEELNRLDHYMVAKNRLQNRHLHGWGVVCGLDVVCDDCSSGVIVKPGYALSPCGDDIVVCEDAPVDVCALVQRCVKTVRDRCAELTAADRREATGCDEGGDWILAIRYAERTSRGVTPLRGGGCGCGGGGDCGGDCGCGCGGAKSGGCGCGGKNGAAKRNGHANGHSNGHSNGGCGCGGTATATSRFSTAPRCAPPLECEPTVICEGYTFEVFPVPQRDERSKNGELVDRFMACLKEVADAVPPTPAAGSTKQQLADWARRTRDGLLLYIATHDVYDCTLRDRVQLVVLPDPQLSNTAFMQAFAVASTVFLTVELALLMACLCRVLMPPCPEQVRDALVPLAVVSMSGSGPTCRVATICNWTTYRKYATTFPSLQYWLSALPFGRSIREAIESVCCTFLPPLRQRTGDNQNSTHTLSASMGAHAATASTSSAATAEGAPAEAAAAERVPTPADAFHPTEATLKRGQRFARLALAALTDTRSLDGETLARGIFAEEDSEDARQLPAGATDDLFSFLAIDQMAKPMIRATLPREGGMGTMLRMVAAFAGAAPAEEGGGDLAGEVETLRATVERQARDIAELRARMDER